MWKLTENKDWKSLTEQFSWVKDMESVEQDPIWHAEGNVAVHTQMVLDYVNNTSDTPEGAEMKEILWAAALLHDVEKRSTTITENGRIVSPSHARKGEFTARNIIYKDAPAPFEVRELVVKLVRYHGYPLWFLEKENWEKHFHKLSMEVNYSALSLLSLFDVMGRTCDDKADLVDKVKLFRLASEEVGLLEGSPYFDNDTHKFEYFRYPERAYSYIPPIKSYTNTVHMMSGLPGAGKDTYIQKHLDLPVLSLDGLRKKMKIKPDDSHGNGQVIQAAKEQAKEYLRKKQPFVLNSTNITKQMRSNWIDLFTDYQAETHIIYIETPYKTLIDQNNQREEQVPDNVMDKLINKLEIPQQWEAHKVNYYVK